VQTRQADKTGLIAYRANKYSVPLAYQRATVAVLEEDGQLVICALDSGEVVARHPLACGKGAVLKNTHHDRDRVQQIAELEEDLLALRATPWAHACAPCSRPPPQPSTRISCVAPRPYWPPSRHSAWT
jgi:hypothetical protein